jgi:hypothetical protein
LKAGREPLSALHDLRNWAAESLQRCFPADV